MPNEAKPSNHRRPIIAVTMGDPCGIGPEIICKALSDLSVREQAKIVVIGDEKALKVIAKKLNMLFRFEIFSNVEKAISNASGDLIPVINPFPLSSEDIIPAQPTINTAHAVVKYIEEAVKMAMEGTVDAICTAPINKASLKTCGFSFPGHTEFIKHLTGSDKAVMMLAGTQLRVSLVTIHEPLKSVSELLTVDKICETIRVTAWSLENYFGLKPPRIAVCGLNPHAGESGIFGDEEQKVIVPAVESFRSNKEWEISGPYPPDTVFYKAVQGHFDAVVAMYHDQGLIPLKLLHFDDAVNITLGLPIIRTSVDHGTAYDIAGKGIASPNSLKAAICLASYMATSKKKLYEAFP
ncbi:MAG: 4-hydroxythreonine-4-phosphate dehydrogenase PdxA [Thermodesulforhabdaceae bacterium]